MQNLFMLIEEKKKEEEDLVPPWKPVALVDIPIKTTLRAKRLHFRQIHKSITE